MLYQQQISPVCIAIDCLNTTKQMAVKDTDGALEAATPQLKQTYTRLNQEHLAMADEWFRLMSSRGWYKVSQARPESVSQSLNQLQTVISQAQAPLTQALPQQYQQAGVYGQFR